LSIVSVFGAGGSIKIVGGFVFVYPTPGFVMLIEVIFPLLIDAVAFAKFVPAIPVGLEMVTVGI
jgi:hypothetical protein